LPTHGIFGLGCK